MHEVSAEASPIFLYGARCACRVAVGCDFGLPRALEKSEITISRIANTVILPAVGAQFNSDLIPEWKHIIHMDGFTRLRVLDDVLRYLYPSPTARVCLLNVCVFLEVINQTLQP